MGKILLIVRVQQDLSNLILVPGTENLRWLLCKTSYPRCPVPALPLACLHKKWWKGRSWHWTRQWILQDKPSTGFHPGRLVASPSSTAGGTSCLSHFWTWTCSFMSHCVAHEIALQPSSCISTPSCQSMPDELTTHTLLRLGLTKQEIGCDPITLGRRTSVLKIPVHFRRDIFW